MQNDGYSPFNVVFPESASGFFYGVGSDARPLFHVYVLPNYSLG
jgi:hypothetical protein